MKKTLKLWLEINIYRKTVNLLKNPTLKAAFIYKCVVTNEYKRLQKTQPNSGFIARLDSNGPRLRIYEPEYQVKTSPSRMLHLVEPVRRDWGIGNPFISRATAEDNYTAFHYTLSSFRPVFNFTIIEITSA